MGTLFPDDDEYPDYKPMPTLAHEVIEAAPPLALAATITVAAVAEHEPHFERETGDPTPRAKDIGWELSTSAPSDVQYFPLFDDSGVNVAVRSRYARQQAAQIGLGALEASPFTPGMFSAAIEDERHVHGPHEDHAPPTLAWSAAVVSTGDVTIQLTGVEASGQVGSLQPGITIGL